VRTKRKENEMIYGFDTVRWYTLEMDCVQKKLQQRYQVEKVVKSLYIDRGLAFCNGKYSLCRFSKIFSLKEV